VLRNRRRALWRHRHLVSQLTAQPGTSVTPDVAARVEAAAQMRSVLRHISSLPRQQQDVIALTGRKALRSAKTQTRLHRVDDRSP
jgi:hypothetical protein